MLYYIGKNCSGILIIIPVCNFDDFFVIFCVNILRLLILFLTTFYADFFVSVLQGSSCTKCLNVDYLSSQKRP